jgi:hypothetical protein
MKGVINWADEVVNGLYPLQWHVLGYAQHPDGSPDYARPYHNMPNPNGPISRILSLYSDQVRDNLRTLLHAVEEASAGDRSDEYGPVAALPREPAADPYGLLGTPTGLMHPAARSSMHPPLAPPDVPRQHFGQPGLHPSLRSESFRAMPESSIPYQARAQMTPMQGMNMRQQQYTMPGGAYSNLDDYNRMVQPGTGIRSHHDMIEPEQSPSSVDDESRETEVEYVLAKQYKALRTGERLGFPAYSANKEILGFYREHMGKVGVGQFIPISRHSNEFGPLEILQATEILEDAILKKSAAVHSLKDWGTITNLLDHALVYDWSKDIGSGGGNGPASTTL